MKHTARPLAALAIGMLLLAGGGGALLAQPLGAALDEREREYFLTHRYAQTCLDSLSAVCGSGLFSRDFEREYTEAGRWILAALAGAGAVAFLIAWTKLAAASPVAGPPLLAVLLGYLGLQVAAIAALFAASAASGEASDAPALLRRAVFVAAGVATPLSDAGPAQRSTLAVIAGLVALGPSTWALLLPLRLRRGLATRAVFRSAAGFATLLLSLTLACAFLESPRGGGAPVAAREAAGSGEQRWQAAEPTERHWRSLRLTIAAVGAGCATEPLTDRSVSQGTQFLLSLGTLVGGLGGSASGGLRWPLLAAAGAGVFATLGFRRRPSDPALVAWRSACLAGLVALLACTAVVAVGLLMVEHLAATRFQAAPSFADALLDASSAVGGGGLTSGLASLVSSRNLARGLGLNFDLYAFGMSLLAAGMLLGRFIPLLVLASYARRESPPI